MLKILVQNTYRVILNESNLQSLYPTSWAFTSHCVSHEKINHKILKNLKK